jgi:hypothetical protein
MADIRSEPVADFILESLADLRRNQQPASTQAAGNPSFAGRLTEPVDGAGSTAAGTASPRRSAAGARAPTENARPVIRQDRLDGIAAQAGFKLAVVGQTATPVMMPRRLFSYPHPRRPCSACGS